ncbi:MAG: alpha/beta hydrolase [Chloroflexi bacterium]|nr:alpha/beta hydrolase [Chloroflexota bacterium]
MNEGAPEQEVRARVQGGEIVGSVRGSGPPALLLHGGPGMSDYLADLAAELSAVLTVARYQQRGLAPSVVDGDRTVEGHVADAVAVLDALGWDRAWVIGHSWGGHLAMHLAVARSERLLGLMVLDALGALPDGGGEALGENLMRGLTDEQRVRMEEYNVREEAGEGTPEESLAAFNTVWPHYFSDPAAAPPVPEFRLDLERHLMTWPSITAHFEEGTLERGLARLRMPVLVVHGAASPISYAEAERSAALIPGARLQILPGIGHFPWIEEPGSVRREVEAFLAAASAPDGSSR